MKCPQCGSSEVHSNKIAVRGSGGHAAHIGSHQAMHGHPSAAILAGGLWLAAKAVDQFTEKYKCTKCHYTFS